MAELSLGFKYRGENAARELATAVREFVAELPSEGRDTVLRAGSLVMLLTNLDVAGGAYRGATGTVSAVVRGADGAVSGVHLKLTSQPEGAAPVVVAPMVETLSKGQCYCEISYWPVGYGYAGTYISCQGKTLAKVACGVCPSMPAGMVYVGVTRVRRMEDACFFANVNKYNPNQKDPRKILLDPSVTRVDKWAVRFTETLRHAEAHADLDGDAIEELRTAKKEMRDAAVLRPVGCFICGAVPELAFSPCGHAVSCATCWGAAKNAGVMSCYVCKALVKRVDKVLLVA